jgi:HNH endonuclease
MKEIKGFPNYYINIDGEVFSTKRGAIKKLKPRITQFGYIRVALYINDHAYHKAVHRLVCQSFHPDYCEELQVNHINGIKTDNKLENLEMCTALENQLHAYRIGLKSGVKGSKNHYSKLTEFQVKEIKKLLPHHTQKYLAEKYKVNPVTINDISTGRTWSHI